jgi:hypothetical protein
MKFSIALGNVIGAATSTLVTFYLIRWVCDRWIKTTPLQAARWAILLSVVIAVVAFLPDGDRYRFHNFTINILFLVIWYMRTVQKLPPDDEPVIAEDDDKDEQLNAE